MDAAPGETTQDWLLSGAARPPLVGELERRIDEALATARSSEAAVMTVGAAALDAADQARRAAELAERASAMVIHARRPVPPGTPVAAPAAPPAALTPGIGSGDGSLSEFSARADRLVDRLRRLQRVPLAEPAASGVAALPRYGR